MSALTLTRPASVGRQTAVVAVDGAAVAIISAAICLAADQLALMSVLVPAVIALRFVVWSRLPPEARGHRGLAELAFFAACTLFGGFNDWNSVVHHRVYDYTVPVAFPELTTIPLWMLLFWGLILRLLAGVAAMFSNPLSKQEDTRAGWTRRAPWLALAIQLGLVLATRQCIYRWFDDPLWSWLPFAVALGLYLVVFGAGPGDRRLILITLLAGPLVEVLYIQVGGLHRYHLGWLGGVPVWIALWWVVAVLVWKDLSGHVLRWMRAKAPALVRPGHPTEDC